MPLCEREVSWHVFLFSYNEYFQIFNYWQYRMHPDICQFPSLHFYESKLLNGAEMSEKSAPFHATEGLGPYVFYDISDGQELRGKNSGAFSLYNEHEVDAAVELLRFFKKKYVSFPPNFSFNLDSFLNFCPAVQ